MYVSHYHSTCSGQQLSGKKKGSKNRAKAKVKDLKIKNMTKVTKGTVETPAKNASAKRRLNRSITQQSWELFFKMLKYKVKARAWEFVKVAPRHTSQTFNCCGHASKENRLKQ